MGRLLTLVGALLLGTLASGATWASAAPCCKVCQKGKACGDSCIAKDKDCTKPEGCACDAEQ